MTGHTSLRRKAVPPEAAGSVLALKAQAGMKRKVVPIVSGASAEIVQKTGATGTAYAGKVQYQVRRLGRGGPTETSSRARALKGCKGKRGCDFVECVRTALGHVPKNLAKACPTRA